MSIVDQNRQIEIANVIDLIFVIVLNDSVFCTRSHAKWVRTIQFSSNIEFAQILYHANNVTIRQQHRNYCFRVALMQIAKWQISIDLNRLCRTYIAYAFEIQQHRSIQSNSNSVFSPTSVAFDWYVRRRREWTFDRTYRIDCQLHKMHRSVRIRWEIESIFAIQANVLCHYVRWLQSFSYWIRMRRIDDTLSSTIQSSFYFVDKKIVENCNSKCRQLLPTHYVHRVSRLSRQRFVDWKMFVTNDRISICIWRLQNCLICI